MPANKTQSLPQDKFLTMAANLLYKAFIESSRTRSKTIYKELLAGKEIRLTTVQMEDKSTVQFSVSFDHSEFRGQINFSAFRKSLGLLLSSLGESLRKAEDVQVFSNQQDPGSMIFGVTAVTEDSKHPNVMVLGANMAADRPSVTLQLMYIDHKQFQLDVAEATA